LESVNDVGATVSWINEPAAKVLSEGEIHDRVPEMLPESGVRAELEPGLAVAMAKDTTFATG
jgi:hypothetical protein